MRVHSLKSKIVVNLTILLFLAILLTDYVITIIVEKQLILLKVDFGQNFLLKLKDRAQTVGSFGLNGLIFSDPSLIYVFIKYGQNKEYSFGQYPKDININISFAVNQTIDSGKPQTFYTGVTWGVFWKETKYLTISMPFGVNQDGPFGGAIVIQLDDVYKSLRTSHKLIAIYSIINLIILLLFWFYRFHHLIFKPVQKIIDIAKHYSQAENIRFAPEKRYYEFNELSNALNRMVQRIETDNEKLKNSLKMLKDANAELQLTRAEMIRAEKLASIGRLSAGIAHEIGNPLGIVLGYLGLLKTRPDIGTDTAAKDYLDRAEREINRINEVIRHLLDFSRTAPVRFCPVSIHALVIDIVKTMRDQPLLANINIEHHLSAANDCVYADYSQLSQVLINLIINAADSIAISNNKTVGKIMLLTDIPDGTEKTSLGNRPTLRLLVVDNGAGISSRDLDYIFDPFYTTKEPGKGTGLGLSVSYTIIEQVGGIICADSEIGNGTTMTILLPLLDNANSKTTQ